MFKSLINKVPVRYFYKPSIISDVYLSNNHHQEKIIVKGWVKALRKQKENVFIDISDGSTTEKLQIFISSADKPTDLTTGASIIACGHLNKTAKGQIELVAQNINVIGNCVISDGYPFAPRKSYPPEYIREYLHLRSRTNQFSALLRVRNAATKAIHDFFDSEQYLNIHTPILTANDCEGAGETFMVQPTNKKLSKDMLKTGFDLDEAYFNTKTYLTVSGQLHLEAIAHGMSRVYTFGPTFRAENSKSRLHLSEFYMLEAETAFTDKLEDLMQFIERLIKSITKNVLNKCDKDLSLLNESNSSFDWLEKSFNILNYTDALDILKKNNFKIESDGFSKEHEIFLVKHCGNIPTFIINWPKEMKPFYMKECLDDKTKVAALDLLAPDIGEIVGGSLRENDYNLLKSKLPEGKKELDWYLELRKFGAVPTGGFGLGFERYLQFITGICNIKDTIPFPRWPHNCSL